MSSDIHDLQKYAASGSELAFRRIVERHSAMVRGVAFRLSRNEALVEDITQSVFILLARKARSVPGDRLSGWLHGVTRHVTRNAVRKEMRRSRLHLNYFEAMNEKPSTAASWEEVEPHLDHAVSRLSAEDRELVLLRYFEERSFQEISAATGRSVEACKKRAQRALDRLGVLLGKRGVSIGGSSLASLLGSATVLQPAPASAAMISVLSVKTASSASALAPGISIFLKTMTAKQTTGVVAAVVALAAIPLAIKMNRSETAPATRPSVSENSLSSGARMENSGEASSAGSWGRKGNAEDRSINWAELARTKFSSRNQLIQLQEIKALEERLEKLSDDELAEGLDKVVSLDIPSSTRSLLYTFLVKELSKRDPMRVLDRLPVDKENYLLEMSLAFRELVAKDPVGADHWLERQAAEGHLEGMSGPFQNITMFESIAVAAQLKSNPGEATKRIMALPGERQAEVLVAAYDMEFPAAFETAMDYFNRTGDDTLINRLVASPLLEDAAFRDGEVERMHRLIDRIPDESSRAAAYDRVNKAAEEGSRSEGVPLDLLQEGEE